MSLTSHYEMDNRQLYTSVGTYKGNLVAIRKVNKKNVELTRSIKKELKVVCISDFNFEKKNQSIESTESEVSKDEMLKCPKCVHLLALPLCMTNSSMTSCFFFIFFQIVWYLVCGINFLLRIKSFFFLKRRQITYCSMNFILSFSI